MMRYVYMVWCSCVAITTKGVQNVFHILLMLPYQFYSNHVLLCCYINNHFRSTRETQILMRRVNSCIFFPSCPSDFFPRIHHLYLPGRFGSESTTPLIFFIVFTYVQYNLVFFQDEEKRRLDGIKERVTRRHTVIR